MSLAIQPGQILAGKYQVERVIGEGGMGVVIAALHLQLDRRVALKLLRPELVQSRETVLRFSNEARSVGKIESEHVAKVLDVGVLDDGAPFIVMEYLDGRDLSVLIKQGGALPWPDAIEYVLQACEALAEAHVKGIVHRDLKPANLFLIHRPDGSPAIKVLDFGISKAAIGGQEQGLTQTSAVMGSPSYMAPEQLKSARQVDARTDVWALGIILHELLTGEAAFKADTVPELYVAILQDAPPPLRSRRRDAPAGLEAAVLRCLEKDPARRFANVGELAAALAEIAPPRAQASIDRIMKITGVPGSLRSRPSQSQQAMSAAGQGSSSRGGQRSSGAPSSLGMDPTVVPGSGSQPVPPTRIAGATGVSYGPGQGRASHPMGPQGYGHPGATAHQGGHYSQQPQQPVYPAATQHAAQHATQHAQQHAPQHTPYGPGPMGPPQGYAQAQPQPRQGMHPSTVILIILVVAVALFGGSCMLCVCVGAAAGDNGGGRRRSEVDPSLPFPPRAGWTTLPAGDSRGPSSPPFVEPRLGLGASVPSGTPRPGHGRSPAQELLPFERPSGVGPREDA
ncbi:MAG: serine/threonine-protein kinase [Byssovorax sp.]